MVVTVDGKRSSWLVGADASASVGLVSAGSALFDRVARRSVTFCSCCSSLVDSSCGDPIPVSQNDLQALDPPHLDSKVDMKAVCPLTLRLQDPAHYVLQGNLLKGQAQNSRHQEC